MKWKKLLVSLIVFGVQLLLFVPANAGALNVVEVNSAGSSKAATELTTGNLPSVLSPQEILEEQERSVDLGEIERFLQEVDREIGALFPAGSLKEFITKFAAGDIELAPQVMFRQIMVYFWREVILNLSLLGKLLLVAVVCAILSILQSAFEQGKVAKVAYFVCFLVVITLAAGSFKLAISTGLAVIEKMVGFMQVLLPVLLVLLTALGGLTTVSLLQPFLMAFLGTMSIGCQNLVFPFISLTAVLGIANNLSDQFKISQLVSFFKQLTKVGIGFVLTLFIGVITVEGVAGGVIDGVTLRTAKYMTGAFVPVAGNMFADAIDAVIGGSLILKNALGLAGVLVLGALVLFPVLKILVLAVIYRFASALLQPLGDSFLANTFEEMAACLFLTFAVVAAVAIMFFMTLAIIVGMANFTVMLR